MIYPYQSHSPVLQTNIDVISFVTTSRLRQLHDRWLKNLTPHFVHTEPFNIFALNFERLGGSVWTEDLDACVNF